MLKEKNNNVHENISSHKDNIQETISHSIKSVRNSVFMRLFLGLCTVAPGMAAQGCSPIPITSVNTKIESNNKLQNFNKLFQISQKNILIEYVKIGAYANKIMTARSNRDLEFKDLSHEEKIQFKTMQEAILTEFKNIYDFFQKENMWTFPKWATTIQLSKDEKSLEMVHPEYVGALNACIIKNGYFLFIHDPVNKKSLLPSLPLSSIEVFNLSQAPESDSTFQSILDKGNMFFEKHLDVFEPIHNFRQLEPGKINSIVAKDVTHVDSTGSSTVGLVNAFYAEYLNSMVFNTENLNKKTKLEQEHIILHELLHTKYSVSNLGIDDKKFFTINDGQYKKYINLVELNEAIADINGLAEMADYLDKPEMFDEFAILLCSILKRGYGGHYLGEDNYTQTATLFIAPLLGEFFPIYKISADLPPKELTLLIESKKITKEIFLKYVRNANSKLASYVQEIKVQASNADKK